DNIPSDNVERKISNAVLFVNTAEPDGVPAFAAITPDAPLLFRDASVDLDVTVYDRSMTPIAADNAEIVWSADGGTVTEDGIFTPASETPGTCTVTAQIRIPAFADDSAQTNAETVLTASTTVYSVDTLDGLAADVSEITVASGGVSAPITLRGIRYGRDVILDVSDVSASFVTMSGGEVITPEGSADAPHTCLWGYVDETLAVHNTTSADDAHYDYPRPGFPTMHLALTVESQTLYLPVTFGAAPLTVMRMEESSPASVLTADSGGTLTRRANVGRNGTAAVSVSAHSVAPVTTPAADNPVRRIDLYIRGTLAADTHAVITCGDTAYTLPWVVSDDFTRLTGWKRISLDLTAAVPGGMKDFTITKLLASDTQLSLVMDDLVYHFGDELPVFVDIDTSWAKEDILTVSRMGVVNGIYNEEDGTYSFHPSGLLTRAEFAVMVCGFLGLDTANDEAEIRFSDQDSIPGWALPYIRTVVSAGIMRGKSTETAEDGSITVRFAAGDTMTRAEVMQVLGEILGQQLYADGGTFGS
ncbi:MAG: S-layer homology domain-containing protein, partial [Clostridia bacterium]|nr:S-layer homology domain-containing protein [Clostridia bacterium]